MGPERKEGVFFTVSERNGILEKCSGRVTDLPERKGVYRLMVGKESEYHLQGRSSSEGPRVLSNTGRKLVCKN